MHLKKQTNIKLFIWKEFHNSLYTKVARVQVLTRVAQCCLALNLKTCHSFLKQSVSRIRINLALRGIESNCIKCICRQRDSELNWRNIFPWRRSLICGLKLEKCRRGRLKLNAFPLAKERERETERETLCATCGTATRRSYSSLSRSRSWTCWCYCCCCTLSISERQLIFHVVSCLLVTLSVCWSVCVCECAVMLTTTPGRMPAAKGNYWADQAMHFAQPTDRSRPDALFALPDPSWRTTTWRTSGQASVRGCYVTLRYLVDFVQ